jgi:ATP-binding cassette subfamily B protein
LRKLKQYTDWGLYRRLWRHVRPYWPQLLGVFLLGLLATPVSLLAPLPLKIAVDSLTGSEPLPPILKAVVPDFITSTTMSLLVFAAALLFVTAVLSQTLDMFTSVLSTYASGRVVLDCRAALFRHLQRLSFAYHDTSGVADSIYRIQADTQAVPSLVLEGFLPLVSSLVQLVAMVCVAAMLDFKLVAMVVIVGPLLVLLTNRFKRPFRRQWTQVKELETDAMGVVQEGLAAARVVKAFGQEEREHKRFLEKAWDALKARIRVTWTEGLFGFSMTTVTRAAMTVFFFMAARDVEQGKLSMGDLFLLMTYITRVLEPLRTIGKTLAGMQSGLVSARRIFFVLDQEPDVPERSDARPLGRALGRIAFQGVSFAYNGDRAALNTVSLEVPAGARVGIRGRTGSGKTTLVSLLTRFFDPTTGTITLDGLDLRDYKLSDLRNQFAIVLQEPVLFSTTIAENIAYGRPSATREEIIAAAEAAHVHNFIMGLPQGYDTLVGERGMTMSGGERQRIALARAFLKDAPILILDEPTSSVDVQTEAAIMEAVETLMRDRTTFLISHRPSTLEGCDVRLELEDGKLVESTAAPPEGATGSDPAVLMN